MAQRSIALFLIFWFLIACPKNEHALENYKAQIEHWQQKRLARLKSAEGWLSLAGLFWLKEGENTFGFGPGHDIQFPDGESNLRLGSFILQQGKVKVRLNPEARVLVDSARLLESDLRNDLQGKPTLMERGRYLWYVIKRGDRFGIRLKDRQSPNIAKLKNIPCFPVAPVWRVKAQFVPYDSIKTVPVPTVLGTNAPSKSPGELRFTINGQTFRLQALAESPNEPFFIIFSDETNGQETYGAGRFIYIDPTDTNGQTYIDFNKAYNPPCVFTEFATCPLPPPQNHLPIRVTAGEKLPEGFGEH